MPQPPKFQPRRRNERVGPLALPAEGRKGRPPKWPLKTVTPDERKRWGELWRTPQAVAWEAMGWTGLVARYVRYVLAAEEMDKEAMTEARQLEDRLGLSPKAMRLLLWTIASSENDELAPVVSSDRWRAAAS